MSHEDVLLYLRTCEVVALCIGFIEFIEIDGKFLARAFSYTDDHLGGDVQSDVSDACYAFYLFDAYELFSHFLLGQVGPWLWLANQWFATTLLGCGDRHSGWRGEACRGRGFLQMFVLLLPFLLLFYLMLIACVVWLRGLPLTDGSPVDVGFLQLSEPRP